MLGCWISLSDPVLATKSFPMRLKVQVPRTTSAFAKAVASSSPPSSWPSITSNSGTPGEHWIKNLSVSTETGANDNRIFFIGYLLFRVQHFHACAGERFLAAQQLSSL